MKQHHITIYGPGCPRCDELARMTEQATNSLPGAWEIRKEKDPERMAAAGVLSTPGLELDGKLLLTGKVPTLPELQRLLAEGADCRPASAEPSTPCACSCGGGCACGSPGKPLWKRVLLIAVTMCAFRAAGGAAEQMLDAWAVQGFSILGYSFVPIPGAMGVADLMLMDGFGQMMAQESAVNLELLSRSISFYSCILICGAAVLVKYLMQKVRKQA